MRTWSPRATIAACLLFGPPAALVLAWRNGRAVRAPVARRVAAGIAASLAYAALSAPAFSALNRLLGLPPGGPWRVEVPATGALAATGAALVLLVVTAVEARRSAVRDAARAVGRRPWWSAALAGVAADVAFTLPLAFVDVVIA